MKLAVAIAVLGSLALVRAQTAWVDRTASSGPGQANLACLAYDDARQRLVLFGGMTNQGQYPTMTWERAGTTWQAIATATAPGGRAHATSNGGRGVLGGK